MKIYLDIDNTIIYSELFETYPAKHLKEFLTNSLMYHEVFWLSTHCNGNVADPIEYLDRFLTQDLMELMKLIKPTIWNTRKIEAIDLHSEFLWFDDTLLPSEEKILKENNKLDSYIKVDIKTSPDFWANYLNL